MKLRIESDVLIAMQCKPVLFLILIGLLQIAGWNLHAQSWQLTPENIDSAIQDWDTRLKQDTLRPAFHLTPPSGCMGDPNGGIFSDGWYHIFYGLQPFAHHPGGWYWAHAKSQDLLHWKAMKTGLTPAFEMGLNAVGSGSTIITEKEERLAFYSSSKDDGPMQFWQAQFMDKELSEWEHTVKDPILTLDQQGLPPFDGFWRDPFVFSTEGRTFLIACADLFESDYVPVPIFEARDETLTGWDYKGLLFTYPKHKLRNLEVPELRPLGDQWIFMASSDAPVDRCVYFIGEFDINTLTFTPQKEGCLDYSGHYYAQESILDDSGNLYVMAWMPGWDREWLPTYMNEPLKNSSPLWNGCFALPRRLTLDENGDLLQNPVPSLKQLRTEHIILTEKELPVYGPTTVNEVLPQVRGNQLEIEVAWDLQAAAFCGMNVLCGPDGIGGLYILWSGDVLTVDGIKVPLPEWTPGTPLALRIFIDKMFVEIFVNGGKHCISRQVRREHIKGDYVALTRLGGTARLLHLEAWKLKPLK